MHDPSCHNQLVSLGPAAAGRRHGLIPLVALACHLPRNGGRKAKLFLHHRTRGLSFVDIGD